MKSWLCGLGLVVLAAGIVGLGIAAEDGKKDGKQEELVGAKDGSKYHLASCASAKNIKAENKVTFKTAQDAFEAGYAPCGNCTPPVETKVVASKESDKYHFPSCKAAAKIKSGNQVEYKSPEDAAKDGKTPCGICKPPAPAKADGKKDEGKKSDEPKK
jgi:methylphosphotriester-DNA--protein-cysteine methyltransferase